MQGHNVADLDPQEIVEQIAHMEGLQYPSELSVNTDQFEVLLNPDFQWETSGTVRFFYTQHNQTYRAQLRLNLEDSTYTVTQPTTCPEQTTIYGLRDYLEALKYLPQEEIRRLAPDADQFSITHVAEGVPGGERTITYTDDGVSDLGGWFIHLVVHPLYQDASGGYQGTGDEAIHLFYGRPPAQRLATYWGADLPGTFQLKTSDTSLDFDASYLELFSDGSFTWSRSILMSSVTRGYYEETADTLTLYIYSDTIYVFDKKGDSLIYNAYASTQSLPMEEWAYLPGAIE